VTETSPSLLSPSLSLPRRPPGPSGPNPPLFAAQGPPEANAATAGPGVAGRKAPAGGAVEDGRKAPSAPGHAPDSPLVRRSLAANCCSSQVSPWPLALSPFRPHSCQTRRETTTPDRISRSCMATCHVGPCSRARHGPLSFLYFLFNPTTWKPTWASPTLHPHGPVNSRPFYWLRL
jgi:hypothetical protein